MRQQSVQPHILTSPVIDDIIGQIEPVSLEQTLADSAMLTRVDNKYLINQRQFGSILQDVSQRYRILTIDAKNVFAYRSKYFDDHYRTYYEHHQGRRRRFKLRIREYVDSGALYFELKLKGLRGKTVKFRESCDSFSIQTLDDRSHYYLLARDWYESAYRRRFPDCLSASLIVSYSRIALVSTVGQERVTVDTNISYQDTRTSRSWALSHNAVVVETKTEKGTGEMDQLLKSRGYRRASGCSKYCLGLAQGDLVDRNNRFLPVLRKVRQFDRNLESVRYNIRQ